MKERRIALAVEIFAHCAQAGANIIGGVRFALNKFLDFHALGDMARLRRSLDIEGRKRA